MLSFLYRLRKEITNSFKFSIPIDWVLVSSFRLKQLRFYEICNNEDFLTYSRLDLWLSLILQFSCNKVRFDISFMYIFLKQIAILRHISIFSSNHNFGILMNKHFYTFLKCWLLNKRANSLPSFKSTKIVPMCIQKTIIPLPTIFVVKIKYRSKQKARTNRTKGDTVIHRHNVPRHRWLYWSDKNSYLSM